MLRYILGIIYIVYVSTQLHGQSQEHHLEFSIYAQHLQQLTENRSELLLGCSISQQQI